MHKMTCSQAKAFRDRWDTVAAAEAEERRGSPLRLRWEQLNALRRLAVGLEFPSPSASHQEKIVWERWAGLKRQRE